MIYKSNPFVLKFLYYQTAAIKLIFFLISKTVTYFLRSWHSHQRQLIVGWGRKNTTRLKREDLVDLFSPFILWGNESRKKWITDTMCGVVSLFFKKQTFHINICLLVPQAPKVKDSLTLSSHIGFLQDTPSLQVQVGDIVPVSHRHHLDDHHWWPRSRIRDRTYLVTPSLLEEMLNFVNSFSYGCWLF